MLNTLLFPQQLTFTTVPGELQRVKQALVNTSCHGLQLDLQHVTHCDSAGLALLIEATRLGRELQKVLEIHNASENIYALAEFCGVQMILDSVEA